VPALRRSTSATHTLAPAQVSSLLVLRRSRPDPPPRRILMRMQQRANPVSSVRKSVDSIGRISRMHTAL
jgi:hypothetical protein